MGYNVTFSHDYNGQELLELYTNIWYQGDHSNLFTFRPMISSKANLYISDVGLKKIMKRYSGCGISPSGTLEISDRVLEVFDIEATVEQCQDIFDGTAWDETLPVGVRRNDPSGTELGNYLEGQYVSGLVHDWCRVDWFGDRDDADTDYNQYSGFFKWITDTGIVPAGQRVDISGSPYTDGSGNLLADGAYALFEQITSPETADITLRQASRTDAKLYVTTSLLRNYKATLRNQGNVEGQRLIQNGQERYFFDNYEVVPMDIWDQTLLDAANPYDTALNANGGHVCLFTTPKNLVIGSDIGLGTRSIESWYEKKDQKYYTNSRQKRGTIYLHDKLMSVAY